MMMRVDRGRSVRGSESGRDRVLFSRSCRRGGEFLLMPPDKISINGDVVDCVYYLGNQ